MNYRTITSGFVVVAAALAGCYTGGDIGMTSSSATAPTTTIDGTDPTVTADGLPCDVLAAIATCSTCHGSPTSAGAANRIMTYEDLVAPSLSDPSVTVAEMSATRMADAKKPMPPSGVATAGAAVLSKWVAAGMPKATCADPVTPAPADTTNYNTPSVCSSGKTWAGKRNSSMAPGQACQSGRCHGGDFDASGTIYPTAHEPDNCNGTGGSQVIITDAAGQTYSTTVNSAGNFYFSLRTSLKLPYTAKVVSGSKTRVMVGAQTNGDCNACHTEKGTQNAPGRMMAP
jgi:mono/diheme cytochrome c family protein